jgi:hypothetical protein
MDSAGQDQAINFGVKAQRVRQRETGAVVAAFAMVQAWTASPTTEECTTNNFFDNAIMSQ